MPLPSNQYDAQLLNLERKRAVAKMLREKSMQDDSGQMAGRVYVPASPLQGLAGMLTAYASKKRDEKIDAQEQDVQTAKQSEIANIIRSMPQVGQDDTAAVTQLAGLDPNTAAIVSQLRGRGEQRAAQEKRDAAKAPTVKTFHSANGMAQDKQYENGQWVPVGDPYDPSKASGGSPYFTAVPTASGIMTFDNRTGQMIPTPGGQGVIKTADDPNVQGAVAGSKERGKMQADAQASLPGTMSGIDRVVSQAGTLLAHPGLDAAYGTIEGALPTLRQETKDAEAIRDQLVASLSLENRTKLKGSGAISDFEAKTLEKAATVLGNPRISPKLARDALADVASVMESARQNAIRAAGGGGGNDDPLGLRK